MNLICRIFGHRELWEGLTQDERHCWFAHVGCHRCGEHWSWDLRFWGRREVAQRRLASLRKQLVKERGEMGWFAWLTRKV